jgi:hypothetical protein
MGMSNKPGPVRVPTLCARETVLLGLPNRLPNGPGLSACIYMTITVSPRYAIQYIVSFRVKVA